MSYVDELIRDLELPCGEDEAFSEPVAEAAARRRLRHAIADESTNARKRRHATATMGSRGRRRIGRLIPLATLTSVAAAGGIALLISQVLVRGGAGQPQTAAAAVLRRAADAALASPPAQLRPGQYWFEENQGTYLDFVLTKQGGLYAAVSQVARYWIGAGHWQRQDRLVRVRAVGPIIQPWQRSALSTFAANPSITATGNTFDLPLSYARMLKAPSALPAVARFVTGAEAPPGFKVKEPFRGEDLITGIHDILIEPMVPARLHAALFRLAATIPGVHVVGSTYDTLGRAALAVGFVERHNGVRAEFLFDPVSYALLDYREVAIRRIGLYIPAGTVMQETAFIRAGLVHQAPPSCHPTDQLTANGANCVAVGPNP